MDNNNNNVNRNQQIIQQQLLLQLSRLSNNNINHDSGTNNVLQLALAQLLQQQQLQQLQQQQYYNYPQQQYQLYQQYTQNIIPTYYQQQQQEPQEPQEKQEQVELECKICNKQFKNANGRDQHFKTHHKCSKGCGYEATLKLVHYHEACECPNVDDNIKKQNLETLSKTNNEKQSDAHGLEIDNRIKNLKLDTPEEIAAWIAERKSKYPTKTNIENKLKQQNIRDDLGASIRTDDKLSLKRKADNGLDVDNASKQMKFDENICQWFIKSKCKKGKSCKLIHDFNLRTEYRSKTKQTNPDNKQTIKHNSTQILTKSRANLLQLLLQKDIRKEHNILLQCVRHLLKTV